jgi:hypothetical protein
VGTFSNIVLVLGLVFGVGLVWFSAPAVNQATERIDRAFFRSAYDARQILESLVVETRTVTSREELAEITRQPRTADKAFARHIAIHNNVAYDVLP